jgi:CRISPR system Cascade subunit CasE
MIASEFILTQEEAITLKLTDAYSVHRIIYDLFEDVRSDEEKKKSISSGILFVDKGVQDGKYIIWILSTRPPRNPLRGSLQYRQISDSFLTHDRYIFEVIMNPTRRESSSKKIVAIQAGEALRKWFLEKAPQTWGFRVNENTLRVDMLKPQKFWKNGNSAVTHSKARFIGDLQVVDRDKFAESFRRGIGRGRAFGFGFLQVIPIAK